MLSTAICFVVANPPPETRLATLIRSGRFGLSRLPIAKEYVRPHWSPTRRMGYGAGLRACVHSIRRLHREVPPILVLRPRGQEVTIADIDGVISFDAAPYASIPAISDYFGREVFYKFELFRSRGFDRILYLDCDTLVINDISALWDPAQYTARDFYAVREEAAMGVLPPALGTFNAGVMVLNRGLLHDTVAAALLERARVGESFDCADQGIINAYLEAGGVTTGELDAGYNVLALAKKEGDWAVYKERLRILHFASGLKPWSEEHHHDCFFDEEFKRWWDDAYHLRPGTTPTGDC